jgi:nucleoside-diphosphate-sugar epimerase
MDLKSENKGFVGNFIRKALAEEKILIYGDGRQRRDFNYVDDVVRALLLAGSEPQALGQVFNLGHPQPYSLLEFVETLGKFIRIDQECVEFPSAAKAIDIGDYYGDYGKFKKVTGWDPTIDLAEGLERTVDYYRGPGSPSSSVP